MGFDRSGIEIGGVVIFCLRFGRAFINRQKQRWETWLQSGNPLDRRLDTIDTKKIHRVDQCRRYGRQDEAAPPPPLPP